MKTLEFIYQETQIHFLVNPTNKNVMVNATEMAKMYGKRTDVYLKTKPTKALINELKLTLNGGSLKEDIISFKGRNGIYFNKILALDFAAWLDVKFKVWIYQTVDEIIFGNYKKHWEAHAQQEQAKVKMEELKKQMLLNPTPEMVRAYFEQMEIAKNAKNAKTKAIRQQLSLFDEMELASRN